MTIHIVFDLLLQSFSFLDLVNLGLFKQLEILEDQGADYLPQSLVFVRPAVLLLCREIATARWNSSSFIFLLGVIHRRRWGGFLDKALVGLSTLLLGVRGSLVSDLGL